VRNASHGKEWEYHDGKAVCEKKGGSRENTKGSKLDKGRYYQYKYLPHWHMLPYLVHVLLLQTPMLMYATKTHQWTHSGVSRHFPPQVEESTLEELAV
jgi:hypothetical protein